MNRSSTSEVLSALRAEDVSTWFDLGLYLDRLREGRGLPGPRAPASFDEFADGLARGVAFITFEFAVDGVTVEAEKYAQAFRKLIPNVRMHYVAGHFADLADHVIGTDAEWHCVEGIQAFDNWPLYRDFFQRKLERGGPLYNQLITQFWDATLEIIERLCDIVLENDIQLFYLINVSSNPGNVALALAVAILSEMLEIPVVSNAHDFYWEGGASAVEREQKQLARGPRDHFFTNSTVGEIFSIIELLYPWESRLWVSVCINHAQSDALCEQFGVCPASVSEIGTAIDEERFAPQERHVIKESWRQLEEIFSGSRTRVQASPARELLGSGGAEIQQKPRLIARTRQNRVELASNNILLLQPTRIIGRKKIEVNLRIIADLFKNREFAAAFRADESLKLTLLVTGPVAVGHDSYLERIIRDFEALLGDLPADVRDRVYLALLFSAFDDSAFRARHEHPLGMPEFYNLASLVVLPSQTEGRGLPIIESAACGAPILSRRYEPQEVFDALIGADLPADDRLQIDSFTGARPDARVIEQLAQKLISPVSRTSVSQHNRGVIERRFSMPVLTADLQSILEGLHGRLQSAEPDGKRAARAFANFDDRLRSRAPEFEDLVSTSQREYLAGFGRMGFMLMLKSLIDPSYFRIEEQRLRSMAYHFARGLARSEPTASRQQLRDLFNSVEALFLVQEGELPIQIDHSLAYRHRNRLRYPYRELTPQELTGVIALIHREIFARPPAASDEHHTSHRILDWMSMVARCCGAGLAIDDRPQLMERLTQNVPIALFLGSLPDLELEGFVLETVKLRLGLDPRDEIDPETLDRGPDLAPITVIERREALPGGLDAGSLIQRLEDRDQRELALLHRRGICRVVESDAISAGIDLRQLGSSALQALLDVRAAGGFVIACDPEAAMTTDGAAIDRFHIGRADDPLTANILGIPEGAGYVQWAPAGLRSTLAYPTPVQTAQSLSETLRSRKFRRLCRRLGEAEVMTALRKDAETRGSTVEEVLDQLSASQRSRGGPVGQRAINGVYDDGSPWSGVIATVPRGRRPMRFAILSSTTGNQTVSRFVRRFNRTPGRRAKIAWNGGYILNAELVGKLGLPESYIGSPLGLILSKRRISSPPLFNKPAFICGAGNKLSIRRVSCEDGLVARAARSRVEFPDSARNPSAPPDAPCFYDLLHPAASIEGDGRTLVRLVGNRVMEIRETRSGESFPVLPVGLVLSFPPGGLPNDWEVGRNLLLSIPGLEDATDAVEAGPMLLEAGEICLDMEREGWKTANSIATQAARLDYLDMRGPKIAIGLDPSGELAVLVVNGRIRESVGATHLDMAQILRDQGMAAAMGFDPGGSATLVVGDKPLNISPYNKDYERNVYALPPEPRAVANAVVGY